jgi:hypothetical protein
MNPSLMESLARERQHEEQRTLCRRIARSRRSSGTVRHVVGRLLVDLGERLAASDRRIDDGVVTRTSPAT